MRHRPAATAVPGWREPGRPRAERRQLTCSRRAVARAPLTWPARLAWGCGTHTQVIDLPEAPAQTTPVRPAPGAGRLRPGARRGRPAVGGPRRSWPPRRASAGVADGGAPSADRDQEWLTISGQRGCTWLASLV